MAPPAQKDSSFASLPLAGKIFGLVLILGVVSAIYYFAFHMALADEIESAENQYIQLQSQMQEAQRRQQEYLRLTQELANREGIDRANKRVLPEDAEIAAFLQDLNRTAELSGLAIQLVEPQPEQTAAMYIEIPVSLGVEGRYHQLAKFFYNVSRLERAISMNNITLNLKAGSGGAGASSNSSPTGEVLLSVDVIATTFRRPDPGGPGGGPAAGAPGGGAR